MCYLECLGNVLEVSDAIVPTTSVFILVVEISVTTGILGDVCLIVLVEFIDVSISD